MAQQLTISLVMGQNAHPYILKEEEVNYLLSDLSRRELDKLKNSPNLDKNEILELRFKKRVSWFVSNNNYIFSYEKIVLLVNKLDPAYVVNKIIENFKTLFSLEVEIEYI